jgi:PAS domain S-box-containing protein
VDVPFSHGTLSLNSATPDVFSERDLCFFQELAEVLSEGFQRIEDLEQLAQSEQRYRTLVETSDSVIMLVNPQGPYFYVSPQIGHWIGYAPEEFYADPEITQRLIHPDDWPAVQNALYQAVQKGTVQNLTCRWRSKNGEYRWASESILPVYNSPDSQNLKVVNAVQVIVQDITDRKRAEEALQKAHDDLETQVGERTAELTNTVEELQKQITERQRTEMKNLQLEEQLRQSQKMEAVGQLTAGISHNFNNILMIIMGNNELASREAPESLKSYLQEVEKSALRGAEMIQQLMTFSHRGNSAEQNPVEINDLVQHTVEICRKTFDRKIDINCETPGQPLHVRADPSELEQTFLNLCLNARDALDDANRSIPCIYIKVDTVRYHAEEILPHPKARPGLYARVQIADNGAGMDEKTQERVFEPFFSTKEVNKGTGLGLATAYAIVHRYRGWFEVQSTLGVGTTFSVYLRATQQVSVVQETVEEKEIAGGTETILIVDDEEEIRAILALMLERKGYTVLQGTDGEDGLEVFKRERNRIDLVLLDLVMPRMSGQEVLAAIHAIDPDFKVVISTGITADEVRLEGARDLISKPYRAERVLQTVRRALDS